MNKLPIAAFAVVLASGLSVSGANQEERTLELKDGSRIVLQKDGKTMHDDASGKRMRMKDGVIMEGKDGAKYLMKNDVIWKQITEKGTLAPNR